MMCYSIQSRISNDTKNARKRRFKGLERGKGYAVMSWMIKGDGQATIKRREVLNSTASSLVRLSRIIGERCLIHAGEEETRA
jgi:hypothetical protein